MPIQRISIDSAPMQNIRWIEINHAEGIGRIVLMNGRSFRIPNLQGTLERREMHPVVRSRWVPTEDSLKVWLDDGQVIFAELPQRVPSLGEETRPSIYLDQKDWSTLWKTVESPSRVPDKERYAAQALIALAESKRVILPMSSAHLLETGQWQDARGRYRLGLTIMRLSKGWQLRHPLEVRRQELITAMEGRHGISAFDPRPVITLDANAAFQSFVSPNAPQSTLPAPIDAIVEAIIGICATASTLLGDEDIRANVEDGWTAARQHESAWVHEDKKARLTADIADAFAFTDAMKEISIAAVIAGISPEDLGAWLTNHYREDLAVMPALSFYYEAISDKRADPRAPWERNDLHDLMFLCTAAAYADYTVGERRTVDLLKRSIRRQSKDVVVCSSIAELMSRPEMADMRSRG